MYAILFSKQSLFSNIVIFYLAKIGFMLNKIVWHSECYIKYSIGRDKISKIPQYTEDHILRKKNGGKEHFEVNICSLVGVKFCNNPF